jgi:uncharacterized phiE125 gp8 family phage protein
VPFGNIQIVPPAAEPVDLSIAKSHLRVSGCDEDAYIAALVSGARQAAERECGLQFVTATYRLTLDDFPRDWQDTGLSFGANVTRAPFGTVHLPVGPVASVVSVQYYDTAGALQTLDPTTYSVGTATSRIVPITGWPIVRYFTIENVAITYTAGFGGAAQVPGDAVGAILLILADRYQNRGDNVSNFLADRPAPAAAVRLLNNLRDGRQW